MVAKQILAEVNKICVYRKPLFHFGVLERMQRKELESQTRNSNDLFFDILHSKAIGSFFNNATPWNDVPGEMKLMKKILRNQR